VPYFARLEGSKKFLQSFDFFSLYIKMGTDVTDFNIQLPYDTNMYSMLQKLIIIQTNSMNLYSLIVHSSICLFVFLALQPIVIVFSQPGSWL
jgi:hypothetical protein